MKVYGELEKAQLELLASDPTGDNLYEGRVWFNTVDNTFKFYDGSAVKSYKLLEALVADLNTLSGVAANSTDLGTFTGSTIGDNQDVKTCLQDLETYIDDTLWKGYNYLYTGSVAAENTYATLRDFTFTLPEARSVSITCGSYYNCDDDVFPTYEISYGGSSFPMACAVYGVNSQISDGTAIVQGVPTTRDFDSANTAVAEYGINPSTDGSGEYTYLYIPSVRLPAGSNTIRIRHREINNESLISYDTWITVK